jgi:Rap1a immunity proteins
MDQGHCLGIVVGIAYLASRADVDITELTSEGQEWMIDMLRRDPTRTGRLCVPKGVTHGQSVRVVIAYIEARPKRMHEPFWQLTYEALVDAWPCSK